MGVNIIFTINILHFCLEILKRMHTSVTIGFSFAMHSVFFFFSKEHQVYVKYVLCSTEQFLNFFKHSNSIIHVYGNKAVVW